MLIVAAGSAACRGLRIQTGPEPTPTAVQAASAPPPTFVKSTSDTRTTRLLEVREGMAKDALFKAVSDGLAAKYTVDVSDPHAGFLMTTWQTGVRAGVPDLRYRSRIIVRFLGDDWKQMAVRSEANWQRGDEWDIGYDVEQLAAIAVELNSRVGKKLN